MTTVDETNDDPRNTPEPTLTRSEVVDLIKEIQDASRLYYLEGTDSPLTDDEFDTKQRFLEGTARNAFPDLFVPGTDGHAVIGGEDVLLGAEMRTGDPAAEVVHEPPMLSLAKAKKPADLLSFTRRTRAAGAESFRLQAKLDGVAISILFDTSGRIDVISTRGDGHLGTDVTSIVRTPGLTIKGIPHALYDTHGRTVEVRGELFFSDDQFCRANDERADRKLPIFAVPRNAVAGIIKKSSSGLDSSVELTFGLYGLVVDGAPANEKDITAFTDAFITVDELTTEQTGGRPHLTGLRTDDDLMSAIEDFGKIRETFTIPTDGVVIKPENEAELLVSMGSTAHHPSSQIAWKFPTVRADAVVRNITFTVGKTGKITPVVEFTTVVLDGSNVSRASLHNFELLSEKDIRIGSIVSIEKANEIIPQVVAVISSPADSTRIAVPTHCPSCGSGLVEDGRNLFCRNPECPSRSFESLEFAVGRDYLDIDRLSTATLRALYDAQVVTNIADIFDIDETTLANTQSDGRRVGEKTASHIISHIEKARTKEAYKVLAGLAIPGIGRRASKKILTFFNNDFGSLREAPETLLEEIPTLGTVRARSLHDGLAARSGLLDRLSTQIVSLRSSEAGEAPSGDKEETGDSTGSGTDLSGLSFSISGSVPEPFQNRNDMVDWIEMHGGTFHSSPRNDTSFLIGSPDGTSAKIVKARKFGIEFISPEEFTSRFVNAD